MAEGKRPMVGPNKILTVSYGTFSCTLEGFEDPFSTMKAIAEYFRNLAAEDRYFGAEPPVPDAAMLHRIAEKEIQRRVEARVQEGGVLLRATEPDAAPAARATAAEPPAAEPPAAIDPAAIAPAPAAGPVRAPRLVPAAAPAPATRLEESVAAKLARIRAAVDRARIAPAPVAEIEEAEEVAAPAPAAQDRPDDGAAATAADDRTGAAPPQPETATAEAPSAGAPPAEAPSSEPVPDAAADSAAAVAADAQEPNLSGPFGDAVARAITRLRKGATSAGAVASGLVDDGAEADAGDPDPEASVGRLAAAVEPAAAAAPAVAPEPAAQAGDRAPDAAAGDDDLQASIRGGLGLSDDSASPGAGEARTEPAATDPAHAPAAADAADDAAADAADEGGLGQPAPVAAGDPQPPAGTDRDSDGPGVVTPIRARVFKVRRSARPAPAPAAVAEVPAAARLSPEDEADLARELAEVERETAGRAAPEPAPVAPAGAPAPRLRDRAPSEAPGDEAVNRLMRQADSEMEDAETRRRAATIAHLKAAVAATVAERAAAGGRRDDTADRRDPYREDLARAVRPRRPEALPGAGRPRPDTAMRIPPLVLVSEQRVDRPAAAPASEPVPVGPRRVRSGSLAVDRDFDPAEPAAAATLALARFLDLVERLGASQPADLVEVAAVFVTLNERRDCFTRPMLLRYTAGLGGRLAMDREEALRAFGALLRDGRIVKARRGHYAVAANNRALVKARSFAG